jgi:hypothetical protein
MVAVSIKKGIKASKNRISSVLPQNFFNDSMLSSHVTELFLSVLIFYADLKILMHEDQISQFN